MPKPLPEPLRPRLVPGTVEPPSGQHGPMPTTDRPQPPTSPQDAA